jgi:hypothetical protein
MVLGSADVERTPQAGASALLPRGPGLALSVNRGGADAQQLGGLWDVAFAKRDGVLDRALLDDPERKDIVAFLSG